MRNSPPGAAGAGRLGPGHGVSRGQVLDETHAIIAVAVVSRRDRYAVDFTVAWLYVEAHLLVESDRGPVDRSRHRTDQVTAPCLRCCEEVVIELPP